MCTAVWHYVTFVTSMAIVGGPDPLPPATRLNTDSYQHSRPPHSHPVLAHTHHSLP
jgi:hypothetical protein